MRHCGPGLLPFKTRQKLEEHKPDCKDIGLCSIGKGVTGLPKNKNVIFTNYKNHLKVPYVNYANFEALVKKN